VTFLEPKPTSVAVIPETAPFSKEQRAWLNGFFAGLLSTGNAHAAASASDPPSATEEAGGGDDGEAPWHDPAMPLEERMRLAEGRPLARKLFAAMAQQDCGQCGYLCNSYAEALATSAEKRPNLCVPGAKETSRMLKRLLEEATGPAAAAPVAVPTPVKAGAAGFGREQPVEAILCAATRLNAHSSAKDTRHVVLDISASAIGYDPGDSLGLYPTNHPALADAVLAAMRAPADFPVGDKTFRQSLIEDYSLGVAPDMLFELLSYLVGGSRRQKAKLLAKGGDPDGDAASFDVLEALQAFGPVHPDPEAFLECLEPLQPRLYSIASSPLAHPGEVHLTVDTVRYEIAGRLRLGVASTFLADRVRCGDRVKVYIQKAHGFALPANPATPIIMVGPGTGLAPFRAFLWHRSIGNATGKSWLFFGHQHQATDFFYRDELEGFLASGALCRLSTAWSRDAERKVYVQDRMREAGEELWAWLKEGAHFYVCGDAQRMAKDVDTALLQIVAEHGRRGEDAAKDYLVELKAAGRYQADVY
jgi:sulfite reductase (NADPH) flavoprotein alpha-component